MQNLTLVLEGGAFRSLYTSGVLDVLLKENIEANYVIGVSAGALTGMNYVSKQIGRTKDINIGFRDDKRYIGAKALRKEHGLIGFDYLLNEISEKKNIFDYKTFSNSKQKFITVVSNCEKGISEYIDKDNCNKEEIYKAVQASSSMPLCSKMVKINNYHYLDGAVTNSIPINIPIDKKHKNILVVLTRDKNYREPEVTKTMKKVYKKLDEKYPELVNKLNTIPDRYNKTKEYINELEKEGRIIVVQPKKEVTVSRLERDKKKLQSLYEDGVNDMKEKLEELKSIL